jgi:hypothetical protein
MTDQAPDNLDLAQLQQRLESLTRRIIASAPAVAKAKQVRDYDSDRRKRALALGMVGYLNGGMSAAKAECLARASDEYGAMLDVLEAQLASAEQAIAEYEGLRCAWDAARTLISMNKELTRNL